MQTNNIYSPEWKKTIYGQTTNKGIIHTFPFPITIYIDLHQQIASYQAHQSRNRPLKFSEYVEETMKNDGHLDHLESYRRQNLNHTTQPTDSHNEIFQLTLPPNHPKDSSKQAKSSYKTLK
jgi:hypothetical protein